MSVTVATQFELAFVEPGPLPKADIERFVALLRGRGWVLAGDLLRQDGLPAIEAGKRHLRALANQSGGRVAGGQKGYKLVEEMTLEEFSHFRNWMNSQIMEMTRRRIEAENVFARKDDEL